MIKNMASAYIHGPMEDNMPASGKMDSNMVREFIKILLVLSEQDFGKMENVLPGLMMKISKNRWKR